MNWITLDWLQYDLILKQIEEIAKQLNKPDWWEIGSSFIAQLIAAILALLGGYIFQNIFRKLDIQNEKRKDAHRFNEAVVYLSSILEIVVHYIEQLIIPAYQEEKNFYEMLSNTEPTGHHIQNSLSSIYPLEISDPDKFVSKVSHLIKDPIITKAFYSMRNEMLQFYNVAQDRHIFIKKFIDITSQGGVTPRLGKLRFGEIFGATLKLVTISEPILDALIFISYELEEVAKDIRKDMKDSKILDTGISNCVRSEEAEKTRDKIISLIDNDQLSTPTRFLYRVRRS
jgi:hypothetical protein